MARIFAATLSKVKGQSKHLNKPRLCSRCRKLKLEELFNDYPLPAFWPSQRRADLGQLEGNDYDPRCASCQLFRSNIGDGGFPQDSYYLHKVPWENMDGTQHRLIDYGEPTQQRAVFYVSSEWEAAHDPTISYLVRDSVDGSPQRVCQRGDQIDFSLVNSWITQCLEKHTMCKSARIMPSTLSLMAINCDTGTVEAIDHDVEYAALSYVWGRQEEAKMSASPNRSARGAPKVILDAMKATTALGFRYLWVDRYCISSSGNDQHKQIANMDAVYSDAQVTLPS
jgi:hypothetical protein